jgi:hypothetical protein
MKKNRIEIVNLLIAIFALVVAIISIWFSYYTYKDTKTERLNVQASFVHSNYQTKIIPLGHNSIIPLYWELILSNNSEKTLSITEINVENINDENGVTLYSHIYEGLFEGIEDYNKGQIELPININSGESKKVFVRIGIMCDSLASSILSKKDYISFDNKQRESWTRFNQAKIKLAENGIDFYSNKTSVTHENEKIILYKSEAKREQQFKITLTTGKNNNTTKNVRMYMMKE